MSVFIGSVPNTQEDDLQLAKGILRNEIDLKGSIDHLREELLEHLHKSDYLKEVSDENLFLFNRGRDSIYFYLNSLGLNEGDEVIVQAFTCVAVIAPILWNKLKPIYVDLGEKTFNMDLSLLEGKITGKTRAIIIQHTFGNIVDMERVRKLVDRANENRDEDKEIKIIEDAAHIFPSSFKGPTSLLGKYSDMLLFSFSQDKSISSTQGAASIILDKDVLEVAKKKYSELHKPSQKESIYNARYMKLWGLIKKYYFTTLVPFTNITIGRVLIILFRFLGMIKKQAKANTVELTGIEKLSQIQAVLLTNQLKKISEINAKREKIVEIYNTNLKDDFIFRSENKTLLRYPILLENKTEIKQRLLGEEIIVGNWYSSPVHPLKNEYPVKTGYREGSCPVAEEAGKHVLNLPTNVEVTERDAEKIVEIVNNFAKPFNI